MGNHCKLVKVEPTMTTDFDCFWWIDLSVTNLNSGTSSVSRYKRDLTKLKAHTCTLVESVWPPKQSFVKQKIQQVHNADQLWFDRQKEHTHTHVLVHSGHHNSARNFIPASQQTDVDNELDEFVLMMIGQHWQSQSLLKVQVTTETSAVLLVLLLLLPLSTWWKKWGIRNYAQASKGSSRCEWTKEKNN